MNNDYRRFVAALRREIDGGVAPQTYGGVSLDEQVVRDIRSSGTVAHALFVLGAAVWSAEGGELEGIEIYRVAAAHGSREALPALAESLNWMGHHEAAIPMLRAALEADPTDRRLTALLGESLYELGRFDEAEPHLRHGAETDPRCLLPLARVMLARGDSVEYRALLEIAVTRGVYGSHILLGNMLAQTGDRGAAAHVYRQGVTSGDAHSAFNLGVLHYEDDQFDQARAMFAEARRRGDLTRSPFDVDPQQGGKHGA